MYIETERLIIRNVEVADENAHLEMVSDGSLDEDIFGGYSGAYHEWIPDYIKETMRLNEKDNPLEDYLAYTIVEKKRGVPVGSVGCSYYEDIGKVGIVYYVGADFRGNGYASEAAAAYVKYFQEHYNGLELTVNARTRNVASCKVLEKTGFVLKETKLYKDFLDKTEELYNFYELK